MTNIQVTLYLLALLLIYALAAKLDERAALPMGRPLAQPIGAQCMLPSRHRIARPADAASSPAC
jgi:hypothetical protein